MEQKLWMWMCSTLVFITVCNCASHHVPTAINQIITCVYYNHTICEQSGGKSGCGNETQNCTSAENDKPSYCYAVWQNNTNTNSLDIKLKVIYNIFKNYLTSDGIR